jgi:hypothetical protein
MDQEKNKSIMMMKIFGKEISQLLQEIKIFDIFKLYSFIIND